MGKAMKIFGRVALWVFSIVSFTKGDYISVDKPDYIYERQQHCVRWEIFTSTTDFCIEYATCAQKYTALCRRTGLLLDPPCEKTM